MSVDRSTGSKQVQPVGDAGPMKPVGPNLAKSCTNHGAGAPAVSDSSARQVNRAARGGVRHRAFDQRSAASSAPSHASRFHEAKRGRAHSDAPKRGAGFEASERRESRRSFTAARSTPYCFTTISTRRLDAFEARGSLGP